MSNDWKILPDGLEISPLYAAPYVLIDYAWEVLKSNTNMQESDYNGLIPIVPVSDEPEIKEFDRPYIVYGYSLDSSMDPPSRKSGNMTLVVNSTNFRYITILLNILSEAFGRMDESARDINDFTSSNTFYPHYQGIRFGYVKVQFVEGGQPEESEGGFMNGIINLSFEYHISHSVKTSPVLDISGNITGME